MKTRRRFLLSKRLKTGAPLFIATAGLGVLLTAAAAAQQQDAGGDPSDSASARGNAAADKEAPPLDQRDNRKDEGSALGVLIAPSAEGKGVLIEQVAPDSPADHAGLRPGDEILLLDGEKIESHESMMNLLRNKRAGSEVALRVLRGGQQMDVKATLAPLENVYQRSRRSGFRGTGEATGADKSTWLGLALEEGAEPRGAKVMAVYPGGPAARAGLRDGDVITHAGDRQIASAKDLAEIIEKSDPGSEIELTIARGENERKLPVRLGSRMMFAEPHGRTFADPNERNAAPDEERSVGRDDMLGSLPEHVIVLEQNRQLCVQNERLEKLLLQVLQDVQSLREEVAALKNGAAAERATVPQQPDGPAARDRDTPEAPAPDVE